MPDIVDNIHAGENTGADWANNVREWLLMLQPAFLTQDRIRVRTVNSNVDGYIEKHIQRGDIWRGTTSGRGDRAHGRNKPRHIAYFQQPFHGDVNFSGQSAGPGMLWHLSEPGHMGSGVSHWGGRMFVRQSDSTLNGGIVGPWYSPLQRPSMIASFARGTLVDAVFFVGFGTGSSFGMGPSDMIAFVITEPGTVFTRTRGNSVTQQERIGTVPEGSARQYGIWMPDTDTVQFFINGEMVAQHTENIPEVPIRFRCGMLTSGQSVMILNHAMCWSYEAGSPFES